MFRTTPKPTNNLAPKNNVSTPTVLTNPQKSSPAPNLYATQVQPSSALKQQKKDNIVTPPINGTNAEKRDFFLKQKGVSTTAPVQPTQPSLQDQMKSIADMLRQSQEAYMAEQRAMLGKARDSSIAELQKAYADAVANGEMSVREAEEAFKSQSASIEEQAYLDSQASKLGAEGRGIANSQQFMGMMASDNAREMNLHNSNQGARDKRIADVRDRINAMTKQKDLDIARLNSEYEYNLAGASASANRNLLEQLAGLQRDDLNARRDFENSKYLQNDAQDHDKGMQDDSQKHDQDMLDKKAKYDMQMQELGFKHEKEIEKLRHSNTLEAMAKEFGYDIKKMDKQHLLDLAVMAKEYGYDLGLQNDAQAHDKSMQDDAQAFESSENAKQRALSRAMASYGGGGGGGSSSSSSSSGGGGGGGSTINMSESEIRNAILRHTEQLKRTANPSQASHSPLPGSIANENKQRRLFGIYD